MEPDEVRYGSMMESTGTAASLGHAAAQVIEPSAAPSRPDRSAYCPRSRRGRAMTDGTEVLQPAEWRQTACILCECNCGVEVRLGGDGRTFERVRGDKAHPASKGYTCEKALRLDYYQNGRGERLLSPLRRRPDGTFEEIDWDTAISEVADAVGGGSRHPRRRGDRLLRRRRAGQPSRRHVWRGDPGRTRCSVQGERDLAGEDRRDARDGQDVRNAAARRLRALRGGVLSWQEPVDLPWDPSRPHHAQGDRRRSRPGDGRDRSAGDRDRGDGRLPPPGAARPRCLAHRRHGGGARR